MRTKCSVNEKYVLVLLQGAPVIYKPQTKYALMSCLVFRISGVAAVSVWGCYCNLEMALRQMSLGMDKWQPQQSHSSRGFSQGTRVGRQNCQWLPEFVF